MGVYSIEVFPKRYFVWALNNDKSLLYTTEGLYKITVYAVDVSKKQQNNSVQWRYTSDKQLKIVVFILFHCSETKDHSFSEFGEVQCIFGDET